ncbi:hypothetical protein BJ944DRAFT_270994 [Cunninghamella echinulata]|nr:hypothetical protein BJ944DRAFT_270994 [Cunninghamella echinulata]
MLHDLNKVVVFNDRLECRHGKLWYEDEGILTDLSFQSVLEIGHQASNNYQNLRSTPVGYYDTTFSSFRASSSTSAITSTLKRRQHGWRPCILATFYDCILKQNVKKGGLKKGDHFDGVFVFEHREDDTICMEFCQRDPLQKGWDRQGFLLFSEHHIEWH